MPCVQALFTGCILPLWNAITTITATGRHKFLRVTRVRLSTGQRVVGVKVGRPTPACPTIARPPDL